MSYQLCSMSSLSEFVFEGVLMFLVALGGVCLNISSVVYFAQLKTQSAFHRCTVKFSSLSPQNSSNVKGTVKE